MIKILKIAAIIIGALILIFVSVFGYFYYKIKYIKDTGDLQAQVDNLCNKFIKENNVAGLCVGIVKGDKVYIKGYGYTDKEMKMVPDGNTIYEIGSISKVFTATIAQRMVESGQLHWDDNMLTYLPANAKLPFDDTTTLLNLVSHTSGFPRIPDTLLAVMTDECDPYSTLTTEQLNSYLRNCKDKKRPDLKNYDYSNMGSALLANIAEYRSKKNYENLLQELVCIPIGMPHTSLYVKDSSKFATGYNEQGKKTCHWNFPVLYGCGAIRSNMTDMVKFLQANMDSTSAMFPTFESMRKEITQIEGGAIAYGWHADKFNGIMAGAFNIIWHNGGTGGFRTYMGFLPKSKDGVIVLCNQYNDNVDQLGIDLIKKTKTTSFSQYKER